MELSVKTGQARQVVDITEQVEGELSDHSGAVVVSTGHTTCAVTTADLDPGTAEDLLDALAGLLPNRQWRHGHDPDHAPSHLLSSLIGASVVLPVQQGKLRLGSWQRLILVELDGPRERRIQLTLL